MNIQKEIEILINAINNITRQRNYSRLLADKLTGYISQKEYEEELRNNPDNYNITRDINVSPEEIDVLADLSKYIKGVDTLADFVNLFGISKESEQNYLNRGQDLFY